MNRYFAVIAVAGRRACPWTEYIDATDEAAAAFEAWRMRGGGDRPLVRTDRVGHWIASDGRLTVKVSLVAASAP